MTERILLLGSTGSIGTQVLDVVRRLPERFAIVGLAAGRNIARLAEQVREFQPSLVSIQQEQDIPAFLELCPQYRDRLLVGAEGLRAMAGESGIDTVIVGLVGHAGLAPSLEALRNGRKLLTANKETFVAGGHLIQPYLSQVIPIDSEHVAIHQCLKNEPAKAIQTLYLTASGGPFRNHSREQMTQVTRADALRHPNWVMGEKITIDSATMMNKGLEVIEAHWLFSVPYDRIQVVVHPESIIHSGVAFVDGSILMQMGAPDMHGPIQYAMTYPERLPNEIPGVQMNLLSLSRLNLEKPDFDRFPCIRLAYEAGRMGSSATTVLNGADEEAVRLFLEEKIRFMDIPRILEEALNVHHREGITASPTLEDIHQLDAWARRFVLEASGTLSGIH